MNKRQKIIISVTGIFLVLLILIGLTYAYFLTQITGNTNEKSISVTTANLVLEYGDGNNILEPTTKLVPNTVVGTKTFTATNKGDDTIEDYLVYFENVNNTLLRPEDLVYTVTCKSYKTTDYNTNGDNATETGTCNGVQFETQLPLGNGTGTGAILTNTIEEGYIHVYALELKYLEAGVDQSDDMNKTVTAKINIVDSKGLNPYKGNTNSLAYNIVNNAMNVTDEQKTLHYAEFRKKPITTPLAQASLENESVLALTPDDYGVSYYYRGNVENNYVTFNEMCWRIVRIQGDGSIKIVLADDEAGCSTATAEKPESAFIGDGYYGHVVNPEKCIGESYDCTSADYINSTNGMRVQFNTWLNGIEFTNETRKVLKNDTWCIGNVEANYDRFWEQNPSLICQTTEINGEIDKNLIGSLTMDETVFAGGSLSYTSDMYLYENATAMWATLNVSKIFQDGDDWIIYVYYRGTPYVVDDFGIQDVKIRPAVTIKPGIEIKNEGLGTIDKPYEIKIN